MITVLDDDERLFIRWLSVQPRVVDAESCYVYDIGAADGDWFDTFALHAFDANVRGLLFEANLTSAGKLDERYADDPTVSVINCAVSDRHALGLFNHGDFRQHSSLYRRGERSEFVPMNTVLNIAVDSNMFPVVMKIDVEGAEMDVLRGASSVLNDHRPYVQFEYGGAWRDARATRNEAFKLFDSLNYKVFQGLDNQITEAHNAPDGDFVMQNYLAVPVEDTNGL